VDAILPRGQRPAKLIALVAVILAAIVPRGNVPLALIPNHAASVQSPLYVLLKPCTNQPDVTMPVTT
jgi:hypothetical protein